MRRLWLLVMNGLCVLLLGRATTAAAAAVSAEMRRVPNPWQHVNRTCLVVEEEAVDGGGQRDVCDQSINVQHMRELQRHMNTQADPCEDFHAYACGNWQRQVRSHPSMTSVMQLADSQLTDKYVQLFDTLLNEKRKRFIMECGSLGLCGPEHGQVYESLLKYYNVCQKSEPVTLRGYFGALATEAVWRAKPYNWQAGLAQVTRYGQADLFLQMEVKQQNATYHVVRVQPFVSASVHFTREIYDRIGGYTRQNYNTLRRNFERLERELHDIMRTACANVPVDAEGECDLREDMPLAELQRRVEEIDWRQFLRPQLGAVLDAPHLQLCVEDVASIRKIARHLSRQEPELLLAYTLARFANYLQQMPHSLMQADAASAGVSAKHCMRHMRKLFHQPMTFLYEQAVYATERGQSEPLIRTVFAALKRQFRHTLQRNRLQLSAPALAHMQRKLDTLQLNVGNVPANASVRFYIDYMRGVNVSDNFYANHLQALRHSYAMQRSLAALRPGVDDASPWHTLSYHAPHFMDNIDSTAYYFCLNNMIILPHAYMQLPLFHHHFWPALVYGDLGNTLGHELMHAFDANFLLYDHGGNYRDDLAPLFSDNRAMAAQQCCLGAHTPQLTERIADVSGTRLAIDTFMRDDAHFMRHNGRLFFLQFAQFFCGAADAATHSAHDPDHDIDRVRLNAAMAQTPEFAATFRCAPGSAMQPPTRCEFW